jgi:hypothetical protein
VFRAPTPRSKRFRGMCDPSSGHTDFSRRGKAILSLSLPPLCGIAGKVLSSNRPVSFGFRAVYRSWPSNELMHPLQGFAVHKGRRFAVQPSRLSALSKEVSLCRSSSRCQERVIWPDLCSMASRFGSERNLAASRHQGNQPVATRLTACIRNKMDVLLDLAKSKSCLRLTYVKVPLLQS